MEESLAKVGADLLRTCMGLKRGEMLLVVTDVPTREIGEALFQGGTEAGANAMLMVIQPTGKNGAEPPAAVAAAMKQADVVVCPTRFSVTHTQARMEAAKAGARIATMPGITEEMFFKGAISADYAAVADLSRRVTDLLSGAKEARIVKDGKELTMSLAGRNAVASTGLYTEKGQSGNLPTGEAYIAPVEGTASGETIFDGSIAGIGPLKTPVTVRLEKGLLVGASGSDGKQLLEMLGDSPEARNLGELGVGTNDKARITGVILEDEKVYGTVHLAFGDNSTFGGNTQAGVHIDGIILKPDFYLDGKLIVSGGKLLL